MKYKQHSFSLSLIALFVSLSSPSSQAVIAVETNPLLKSSDISLIQSWDIEDIKRKVNIENTSSAITAQISQTGDALVHANSVITQYMTQKTIQGKINKLEENLLQPSTMCALTTNTQSASGFNNFTSDTAKFYSQGTSLAALDTRSNADKQSVNFYNNKLLFCNVNDQLNGLCDEAVASNLQDGDIQASLLFGGDDGITRDASQGIAVDALVNHLTGVYYSPEALEGENEVEKYGLARANYDSVRRRYASVVSLAAEGLHYASSSHTYSPFDVADFENSIRMTQQAATGVNDVNPYAHGDAGEDLDGDNSEEMANSTTIESDELTANRTFKAVSKIPVLIANPRVTDLPAKARTLDGVTRPHRGLDVAVPVGTPLITLADAVVIATPYQVGGAGHYVKLFHPTEKYATLYFHMSKKMVKKGQKIKAGQIIGLSGNTGRSKGPHLHYELYKTGTGSYLKQNYLNPLTEPFPDMKASSAKSSSAQSSNASTGK